MNVIQLYEKLSSMIDKGYGELPVAHLNQDCDFGTHTWEVEEVEYENAWFNGFVSEKKPYIILRS